MGNCEYPYVGKWVGPKGYATGRVVLIAHDWIITAKHVAINKINNPKNVNVKVCFIGPGDIISAKVVQAFCRPTTNHNWWEIALAKLEHYIEGIPTVALASNGIPSNQEIKITLIGKNSPIPGAYCRKKTK